MDRQRLANRQEPSDISRKGQHVDAVFSCPVEEDPQSTLEAALEQPARNLLFMGKHLERFR